MSLTPKLFEKVELNSSSPNACSPSEKLPGWKGLEIRIPEEANYIGQTDSVFMPVCGYYKLLLIEIDANGPMMIYLRNLDSGKEYSGAVVIVDESPMAPIPGVQEEPKGEVSPNTALGSFFNRDLLEFVRFPFLTGNYELWVEYGGKSSKTHQLSMKFQ